MLILRIMLCVSLAFVAGCASIPLTEGGLAVAKDTVVGIEDIGVASVKRGF